MGLLGRRLRTCGFDVFRFPYASRRILIAENARRLKEFIDLIPGESAHFVAHSLGGRVVMRLLQDFPDVKPGRFVALGTPFLGSQVAVRLSASIAGRWLLGAGGRDGLLGPVSDIRPSREIGVIAGTSPFGVGRLICSLTGPSDGTVGVAETRLPGVTECREVNTTHTGLLFSADVAARICCFLQTGYFDRRARGA